MQGWFLPTKIEAKQLCKSEAVPREGEKERDREKERERERGKDRDREMDT